MLVKKVNNSDVWGAGGGLLFLVAPFIRTAHLVWVFHWILS